MSNETAFDGRFEDNAAALASGRPTYPAKLYRSIARHCGGSRVRRVLDVGCGAGHSMDGLFELAEEVHGLEPGDKLRALAALRHPSAHIHGGTGERTGCADRSFGLVTVGTALTWMDTPEVLREVHRILNEEGVLAIYAYGFPVLEGPANAVLLKELHTRWDEHRSPRLKDVEDIHGQLGASGLFTHLEQRVLANPLEWTVAAFVQFLRSTSFVRAFLATCTDPAGYLTELESSLRDAGGAKLGVRFDLQVHLARRA